MELLIFFLKTFSLIYGLICLTTFYLLIKHKQKSEFNINIKTCLEWSLWITSIYVWTI